MGNKIRCWTFRFPVRHVCVFERWLHVCDVRGQRLQFGCGRSGAYKAAIFSIRGPQSGDVVITATGTQQTPYLSVLSTSNVQDIAGRGTSQEDTGSEPGVMTVASPGPGGLRLFVFTSTFQLSPVTWTNATELVDTNQGSDRHAVAYSLGDDGSQVTADQNGGDIGMIGEGFR